MNINILETSAYKKIKVKLFHILNIVQKKTDKSSIYVVYNQCFTLYFESLYFTNKIVLDKTVAGGAMSHGWYVLVYYPELNYSVQMA